jgi:zinc protease
MAFNGSTHIPEGELIPLLERLGLAFGADTNAETGLEHTTYKLDLPRTDAATVDAALTMMREVASELTIAPRGSRARTRHPAVRIPDAQFAAAAAHRALPHRRAAGIRAGARVAAPPEAIAGISAEELRGFYQGYYRPEKATMIVVGDFDVAEMEAKVRSVFADWRGHRRSARILRSARRTARRARCRDVRRAGHGRGGRAGLHLALPSHRSTPWPTSAARCSSSSASLALNNRLTALTRDAATPTGRRRQAGFSNQFRSARDAPAWCWMAKGRPVARGARRSASRSCAARTQ